MRGCYQDFVKLNTEIIVIGSEKAGSFHKLWQDEDLPFVGLPDSLHKVQNLYGQEVRPLKLGRMPAQILVDNSGVVRYAYYGASMTDIPLPDEILDLIKKHGRSWLSFPKA